MTKKRILFLCTGNACRSQMAEGWARHLLGGRVEADSTGSEEDVLAAFRRVRDELRALVERIPSLPPEGFST